MIKPPVKFLEKIADIYKDDTAKRLIHAAAAGWTLACLANVFGITTSKKIEGKQKKYLIPQELADGATNIGLFILTTLGLTKVSDKLASSTKLIHFETAAQNTKGKLLKNIAASADVRKDAVGGIKVIASLIGAVIASNIITPIIRSKFASWRQENALKKDPGGLDISSTAPSPILPSLPFTRNNTHHLQMNSFLAFTRNPGMKI